MQFKNVSIFVGATVAIASAAHADFTDVAFLGAGVGQSVTITSPGFNGVLTAGQLLIGLSNSTGASASLDGNYIAYCADIFQTVGNGNYEFVPVSALPTNAPMGAASAQGIADMYAFAGGAQYGADADLACAFQLAIWEVTHDFGSLDINTGNFQASGLTLATTGYLNLLLGAVGTNGFANLTGLADGELQDLIIEVPSPAGLLLIGMAGLVRGRRRS